AGRSGSRSLLPQDVPGALHVVLGRAEVSHREPQDVAAVELRVGEEDLAASVDALEECRVVLVRALAAEADDREGPRRAELPARLAADPPFERLGERDRVADRCLEPVAAEAAEHRPELERAEGAPERGAVLAQADDLVRRPEVLRHEAEGLAQLVGTTCPEGGAA